MYPHYYRSYKSHHVNNQQADTSVLFSILFQSLRLFTAVNTHACVQHVSGFLETMLCYNIQVLPSHLRDRDMLHFTQVLLGSCLYLFLQNAFA